ncbi:hypothetical protein VTJ04DRAFT_967 [Mycothermus thermophilus]|uniref:uncharacterized protein n=1 Tax=Humicola insolens TaxID=85995 RepID=UPI003744521C
MFASSYPFESHKISSMRMSQTITPLGIPTRYPINPNPGANGDNAEKTIAKQSIPQTPTHTNTNSNFVKNLSSSPNRSPYLLLSYQ